MSRRTIVIFSIVASLSIVTVAAGAATTQPKPVKVRPGLFGGKNGNLTIVAVVADNRRSVLVEFKALMKCPEGANVGVLIDTAIDRRSPISRRGSFRARGPDEDPRGPYNTVMRVSGRFISPRRARGNFRLTDPATGCDSGQIPFNLLHRG